ncbi:MAG: NADPH-dependent 7-cyano-7-deazaguanine reductase QueF [Pseudomonadota bacterium]|nr:NADPH-dependent 7-cyano-7-deazaguanine reductase QueF [Pseudomonadota bacterium]
MPIKPSKIIDSFLNPAPSRDYVVHIQIPEFTCLCPLTGQPDFAKLILGYIPDERCIELKSLKMYIWSFRNEGAFHEAVTNQIVDDLVKAINPRYLKLTAKFYVRGGLFTNVVAEHRKDGWIALPAINLENFSQAHSTVDSEE